jgi:hypothetical protein
MTPTPQPLLPRRQARQWRKLTSIIGGSRRMADPNHKFDYVVSVMF